MTSLHGSMFSLSLVFVKCPTLTVTGRINMIGKFRYGDFKSRLNSTHHLLVCIGRHKCDGKSFGSKTPSSPSG
jgi:hypothetical protein